MNNVSIKKQFFIAAAFACIGICPLLGMNENNKRLRENIETETNAQPKKRLKSEVFDTYFNDALGTLGDDASEDEQEAFIEKYLWNMLPEECDSIYVTAFINEHKKILKVIDDYTLTPLMKALVKNDIYGVKELCERRNTISGDHLYVAMKKGCKEIVGFLLENTEKTVLKEYEWDGQSFIDIILNNNDSDLDIFFEPLLKAGCPISYEQIVDLIIKENDLKKLSAVLPYIQNINASVQHASFLAHCIDTQEPELVEICIKNGARVTERDIINNYIIGNENLNGNNTYTFSDECCEIAQLLGGTLPEYIDMDESQDKYQILFQKPLFQQFVKDSQLIHYLSLEAVNDENWQKIEDLLKSGACPQARGIYYDDQFSGGQAVMSASAMALYNNCSPNILFSFLAHDASLEEILAFPHFDNNVKKIILDCLNIYFLEAIPSLYRSHKKNGINDVCDSLASNIFFNKVVFDKFSSFLKDMYNIILVRNGKTPLDRSIRPRDAAIIFYDLYKNGVFQRQLQQKVGFKKYQSYLLQYPKAAELLFLHSPYRDISKKEKNEHEAWLIQKMKQQNNKSVVSKYRGFLMLGSTKLLNQTKNRNFIDLYFE